ncbi:hypothetical protein Back2_14580 [Nocardioides baekrokdamisoli]|uniref:DUF2127 domain-containing protein n=1 Tax=Nocardioides baekrokdamisoli TaxID=1804624 RepID=A0A3G9IU64_9ACTN|nr:DUF2127 domain-containing protein [Nocardioides baekrokdamisoli]BBH17171.1 hypothetical protein Back2_14580 [Nocardioides baekrokdamisoli]
MPRPFARYNWEVRACGRHGHVLYQPTEPDLAARLHVMTPAGDAWRCLRCAAYVPDAASVVVGPAADAPIVLRGKALKDATILRLLAAERIIRALFLGLAAYGVFRFAADKESLARTISADLPLLQPLEDKLGINLANSTPMRLMDKALSYSHHTLIWVAIALVAYAALELLEGVGLWSLKRWGEYVGAVGTSVLLPLEIYDIVDKTTLLRVVLFLVNVAAVVYLVWSKRLFGVRGGLAAYEAERRSVSLLEVETAAERTP